MARILLIGHSNKLNQASPLADALRQVGFECHEIIIPYGNRWSTFKAILGKNLTLSYYDAVISNEYNMAFGISLKLLFTSKRPKNIVIGLNISSKPIATKIQLIDFFINKIWNLIDLVIVHSRAEIKIFKDLHKIKKSKFKFSAWGFDLPLEAKKSSTFTIPNAPYFCMIGRNNRDFDTFLQALKIIQCKGVIVCSSNEEIADYDANLITIYRDLSMEDCITCVRHSIGNVLLVKDANRGAGHITAVMGMFLAKPHIFTDVSTIQDYLQHDFSGIGVQAASVDAVAYAMRIIIENKELAMKLGENGRTFAEKELSHTAALLRIVALVRDVI